MWQPLRIDHHGWQLALLAWAMASLTDPKRARGGVDARASPPRLSFVIGLEMLPYLAAAGAIVVLMWVRDGGEARRLAAYGVSLGGGCAFGFLVFTSEANMAPICDALTPVWLSAMLGAGAIAVAARLADAARRPLARLALAAGGGAVLAGAFACGAPQCLGRLEQASPELERLWLSKVREAMPIWRHGCDTDGPDGDPADRRPDRLRADALARAGASPETADPPGRRSPCSPRSPPPCSAGRPAPARPPSCCRSPARPRSPGSRSPG